MDFTINELQKIDIYKIMSNFVIPRPIAWISTLSKENILNLAPFSYFTPLSSHPATLIVSIGHKKDGSPKDTLKNLRENKKCSIVIANTPLVQSLQDSAKPLEYNESEFEAFHIKTKELDKNYPKVPKDAKVVFMGSYLKEVELPESQTIPVIIQIEKVFIDDSLIEDKEKLHFQFFDAIARVGAKYYKLGEELEVLK